MGSSIFTNKDLGELGAAAAVTQPLKLTNGFRLTARLTLNQWRFLGHEIGYGYDHANLDLGAAGGKVGMSVHQGFYDFLAHALPEGSALRPFVCAGVGFSSFYPPGSSAYYGSVTKFGYNYGGGVKIKVSPMFGLRFDVRDYVTGKPDFGVTNLNGMLHNVEASAGFSILF